MQAPRNIGRLFRFSSDGRTKVPVATSGSVETMRVSPDGNTIAVAITDVKSGGPDLWLHGLSRPTSQRLTFSRGYESYPVWSSDGSRLYYGSDRIGHPDLYEKTLDGSSEDRMLLQADDSQTPEDVSPDGKNLLYWTMQNRTESGLDVYVLSLGNGGKSKPFLKAPGDQRSARFSPDGRHVVYRSDESGTYQVYVKPFTGPGVSRQISSEGGRSPVWSSDGRTIYFITTQSCKIMSASFDPTTGIAAEPQKHIELESVIESVETLPNGEFLMRLNADEAWTAPNRVYVNWQTMLRR